MSQNGLTLEVLQKYTEEERELIQRIHWLENELGTLHTRLQEVRLIRKALDGGESAMVVPKPLEAVSDNAVSVRRKGRRAASGTVRVNDLGIVDAAIELARQRGVREADAGQILEWFKEVGYKGRHGLPTRNSIYVSLNREFQESSDDNRRVSRPARGRFEFHY
jgi:hypothetical protein